MKRKLLLCIPIVLVLAAAGWLWRTRAFGNHAVSEPARVALSPDGAWVAWLWRDATYSARTSHRLRVTHTDRLRLRYAPAHDLAQYREVPLAAVDFGTQGKIWFELPGSVAFSPDSRFLAATSEHRVVIVDLASGAVREISEEGAIVLDFRWRAPDAVTYALVRDARLQFWSQSADGSAARTLIFERPCKPVDGLREDAWSPDGRFVLAPGDEILDLETKTAFPVPSWLASSWSPDGTGLMLDAGDHIFLVDPRSGSSTDLSGDVKQALGTINLSLASHEWTPEGYVMLYEPSRRGYVIQPRPFQVILSRDAILRPSPMRGWALEQLENEFRWVNYEGTRTLPLPDWVHGWAWSADGRRAASTRYEKVRVVEVRLPE